MGRGLVDLVTFVGEREGEQKYKRSERKYLLTSALKTSSSTLYEVRPKIDMSKLL